MLTLADTSLPDFLKGARWRLQQPALPAAPASRPIARVPYAIISGQQKYTKIHGPVLAIFASPPAIPPGAENDPEMRPRIAEVDSATELQASAFARGVPQARVVRIPRADHYLFRSNEGEVLRDMRAFISSLPSPPN